MMEDASKMEFHKLVKKSQPLYIMATCYRLRRIYERLEGCRDSTLNGCRLDNEEALLKLFPRMP